MRARVPALLLVVWLLAVVGCSEENESPAPPMEGEDFTPTADLTLAGTHTYDAVHIPASVTVTAGDDLILRARETVTIEGTLQSAGRAIELRSEGAIVIGGRVRNPGNGSGDTLGITIVGNGDMTFDGAEIVSSGSILIQNDSTLTEADFPDSNGNLRAAAEPRTTGGDDLPIWIIRQSLFGHDRPARAGTDREGEGGRGGDGRDVDLRVRGHLQILDGVTIAAQDGGRGGKGTDESTSSAVAKGGRGGRGGKVSIFATGEISFDGGVTISSGSGGDGGDAEATGLENDGSGPAAAALATGQRAGDSGLIDIRCREAISILGSLTLEIGDGGRGGNADANAADGQPAGTH
ncbi:MAG: hypothetical protein IT349_00705, partial [Candidatus Eisenbacteria bacterium]|nr:hypothetical protein [Candidatus Eisenbacteria bacterium]